MILFYGIVHICIYLKCLDHGGGHGRDGLGRLVQLVGLLRKDVSPSPQEACFGVEDAGGDAALGPEDAGLELDGVGNVDVGHRDLDHLEVEEAALATAAVVSAAAVVAGRGRGCVVAGSGITRGITLSDFVRRHGCRHDAQFCSNQDRSEFKIGKPGPAER